MNIYNLYKKAEMIVSDRLGYRYNNGKSLFDNYKDNELMPDPDNQRNSITRKVAF